MHYFAHMSLYIFLIVVVSLASGSVAAADVSLRQSLIAPAGMILAWGMLAKTIAILALGRVQSGVPSCDAIRFLERQLELLRWLGLGATAICLFVFNLAGAVQAWPIFGGSMLLQATVLLTPGMSIIALTLLAEHQFGVAMQYTSPGIRPAISQIGNAMMRFVGWMVLPILAMLGLSDLLGLVPASWWPWEIELPSGMIVGLAMVLAVPVLVPLIARMVWKSMPIDRQQFPWIDEVLSASGMPGLDVRYWDTGMKSSNAVVAGFFPGLRSLLLTDRLVEEVPANELRLIVLHEIAHIRRGHIWLRMLSVVPGWLAAGAIVQVIGSAPITILISNTAAIVATLLLLRFSAHATEFDADRVACQMALRLAPADEAEDEGVESRERGLANRHATDLCRALVRVTGGINEAKRTTWLHPSVQARCHRLLDWAETADAANQAAQASTNPVADRSIRVDRGENRQPGDHQLASGKIASDAPFANTEINPILCGSAAAFAARKPHISETIDEPNRCDYV